MKKKAIIAVIIVCIMIVCIYLIYNRMFPYAKPIEVPAVENISSIYISTDENREEKTAVSEEDFNNITNVIDESKPTRIMSINDYPSVRPYYIMDILIGERTITYFIYEEHANTYLEIPYEGIYTVDEQIVDIIKSGFN